MPTPCSPVRTPPTFDAKPQDLGAEGFGARQLALLHDVENDQGMQIAVAGMEDVAEAQLVFLGHLAHASSTLRQRMARNGAVHADHVGREPSHGGKRRLASRPNRIALGLMSVASRTLAPSGAQCRPGAQWRQSTSASMPSASMIKIAFGVRG